MDKTPACPYEHATYMPTPNAVEDLDRRALWIAHSEGRTEVSQLDHIRAERELRLASTES